MSGRVCKGLAGFHRCLCRRKPAPSFTVNKGWKDHSRINSEVNPHGVQLIKDFSRIRDYIREFFVYGFKSCEEIDIKSARSYDNERRRIESWLSEYMSFYQDASGKSVFISVDSRRVLHNPLYQAWKAKSFTKNDIALHFWMMDILSPDKTKSVTDILSTIDSGYLPYL